MDLSKAASSSTWHRREGTGTTAYTPDILAATIRGSGGTGRLPPPTALRDPAPRKEFRCKMCGYQAISESKLTMHIRRHTGEKPFTCSYCPYKTAQKSNLSTHVKNVHWRNTRDVWCPKETVVKSFSNM